MSVSRPNSVMNHGSPAAGRTYSWPPNELATRSAARSTTDLSKTSFSTVESDWKRGTSSSQ